MKIKTALAPILIAMIIGCLFFASMVGGQTNGQSSWPMLSGDPSHTGYIASGALVTPNMLWSYSTNGRPDAGVSSPAVVNGVLYVGSDNLYALNATDGASLWNFSTGGWVDSSPAVNNGVVYVGSVSGGFYALNATNGQKIWNFSSDYIVSSPTVLNGVVYFAGSHTVYALNAENGLMLWNNSVSSSYWQISSSPAVANGIVYIGSGDHNLYALNATTGTELWVYTTGLWVESSPAVANGVVYVVSDDQNLYALNATNGKKLWNYSGTLCTANGESVAVANNIVYVLNGFNAAIKALNAETGSQLWSSSTTNCEPFPIVVGNVLYIGGIGNLFAFNATNGSWLWNSNQIGEILSSPAYANGIVYAQSTNGTIYAFGTPLALTTQVTASPTSPSLPEYPVVIIALAIILAASTATLYLRKKRRLPQ